MVPATGLAEVAGVSRIKEENQLSFGEAKGVPSSSHMLLG